MPATAFRRWNILDSVKRASWSGSSALGGVLVRAMSYEHTFLVTAGLQLLGTALLLPLTVLVRAEKAALGAAASGASSAAPLLPRGTSDHCVASDVDAARDHRGASDAE